MQRGSEFSCWVRIPPPRTTRVQAGMLPATPAWLWEAGDVLQNPGLHTQTPSLALPATLAQQQVSGCSVCSSLACTGARQRRTFYFWLW